jgi:Domain of Unknown Function (DUF1080)
MKRRSAVQSLLFSGFLLSGCAYLPGGGWVTLIDGERGMENFDRVGDANWRAEGGAIVADHGKGGYLVSKSAYTDFEIRAEFWAATDTNSGVFLRCSDRAKVGSATCYEVNVWDIRPEPKYGTGAIVDVAAVPVPPVHKAGGRWNTYEITARGADLTVKLNGLVTAYAQSSKHASGPFALQYGPGIKGAESGPIKWRKVQIRPL